MNEYGSLLRMTREKLGISLDQASFDTKISVNMLVALETMEKEKFPAETYLKGTLVLYARYLKLDSNKLIELLELNEMQEKPVEFDLINLQKNKDKKRKKTIFIFILMVLIIAIGISVVVYREVMINVFSSLFQNQNEEYPVKNEDLEKITGLYEKTFYEGDKIELVGALYNRVLTVVSVSDSIISVGKNVIMLELNYPHRIDLDNDGSLDYLLIMRAKDEEAGTILLRIDPRVNNQGLIQDNLQQNSGFPSVDNEQEIQDIISKNEREDIQLQISFLRETYFRIVSGDAILVERASKENEVYNATLQDSSTVYLDNDTTVAIVVNGVAVNIEQRGLPVVFDLQWRTERLHEVLKYIPRP